MQTPPRSPLPHGRELRHFALLVGLCGLLTVSAQFACDDDPCFSRRTAYYRSMGELQQNRVETFDEAAARQGLELDASQRAALAERGELPGVLALDRPVKHANGRVEMPDGWLPEIPDGHPWRNNLTPADDAFYSWFEERIVDARLFDPSLPEHLGWAGAYFAKADRDESFSGWTYATCSSY